MTPVSTKLYTDDVSLLMVLIDTNPFFWNSVKSTLPFSKFLSHVLAFLNSILLVNQQNQVVVIATGYNYCDYVFDSSATQSQNLRAEHLLQKLDEFVEKDGSICLEDSVDGPGSSLLSGSLSMALCYIQRVFRSGPLHPQPRILCLHGSPDGPGQYVAIMNSIFSAQRSTVPIDSCVIGHQNSAFLQQASYITGGVYVKPQVLDGLFQLFLRLICILAPFYNFQSMQELTFVPHASATKTQSIWASYARFVCLFSASIKRNAQLVGQCLVKPKPKPKPKLPRHPIERGKWLWMLRFGLLSLPFWIPMVLMHNYANYPSMLEGFASCCSLMVVSDAYCQ
ncbi:basal transcription factor complex subunit-related [Striga asiatica]|uniref:General transcription and DNA repair factor IIH subunit TFB4 n=1 Tax=Striga asiatica TaxID=4170 RepID=A0A5A7Q9H1_STRAF|nr:basal transcription factor complex subunit-related [Striga asiatica]